MLAIMLIELLSFFNLCATESFSVFFFFIMTNFHLFESIIHNGIQCL